MEPTARQNLDVRSQAKAKGDKPGQNGPGFPAFGFLGLQPLVCKGSCDAYSYRRLSTGSSCAARAAGAVPNTMPTRVDTAIAMTTDQPEIGKR